MSTPNATQVQHPWRATLRTVFAVVVGLAAAYGLIVQAAGLNPEWAWVSVGGAVAAGITRVLALPPVELLLQKYLPWLSASPKA